MDELLRKFDLIIRDVEEQPEQEETRAEKTIKAIEKLQRSCLETVKSMQEVDREFESIFRIVEEIEKMKGEKHE